MKISVKTIEGYTAVPDSPPKPKTFGLKIEKYVSNIDVAADGTSVHTIEVQDRAITEVATFALRKVERTYNRDLEDVDFSDLYILKADGKKVPIAQAAVSKRLTAQSEAAPSFSSLMMAEVNFGKLDEGDAIHYKYTVRTKKTHFKGYFDTLEIFSAMFDWDGAEVNLTAPTGFPIYFEAIDLNGGKLPDEGGRARWKWTLAKRQAFEIETMMTDVINISPRLMLTSFKDYGELGAAYWSEAAKMAVVTPEIIAKAAEITKGAETPEAQAFAIYQWVNKNIRYLSLVIDRNGWIPHSSTEILANGYGDCKDYSTVLYSLLKAKGIDSYPVLIRADLGTWFPAVATPGYFDHAILYIPSLDVYADATVPNTRLGLITQQVIGKQALLAGEKTGIIRTHGDRPNDSQILSTVEMEVSNIGDVKSRASNTYTGRTELLMRPALGERKTLPDAFISVMLSYFGISGTGKVTKVTDPFRVNDPFIIDFDVNMPAYTTIASKGSFRLPIGANLNSTISLGELVKPETRRSSLVFGAMRIAENFSIKFPDGVVISEDDLKNTELSNTTGSFKNEYRVKGTTVEIAREITINKDIIGPEDYAKIRELISKATEAFLTEIKYTAPATFVRDKARSVAKSPKPSGNAYEEIFAREMDRYSKPTPAEVKRLEAALIKQPDDVAARLRLIFHYANFGKILPVNMGSFIRHRLWLIENHPEIGDDEIVGFKYIDFKLKTVAFQTFRDAWSNAIVEAPSDVDRRINAFNFISEVDGVAAFKIIEDGIKLDANDYRLPFALHTYYNTEPLVFASETVAERIKRRENMLRYGSLALSLIKTERSESRDSIRMKLLPSLANAAIEAENLELTESLARELVLDFGQESTAFGYDEASHVGNILLGRVALRQKNIEKAKEHLLIAIRAPLRKPNNWLSEIDTTLARELFEAGEKTTVTEYLRLCGELANLKDDKELFSVQIKALKAWQDEIKQGKTPSFEFYKKVALPIKPVKPR